MNANNSQNLPIYKRPEYRVIDFLSMTAFPWLSRNLPSDVYHDLKTPLAEIKNILNESLHGEKYKTKRLGASATLYDAIKKAEHEINRKGVE